MVRLEYDRTMPVYVCKTCNASFESRKKDKKFCSHKCYSQRFNAVTKNCEICNESFTVAYRFRNQKACGLECAKRSISKTLKTSIQKKCLWCEKEYECVLNASQTSKFCSYSCFLVFRRNGNESGVVTLVCDACQKEFEKPFIHRNARFCSRSCATSGENNGMYGRGDLSVWTGKSSWNSGKTALTDKRVAEIARKNSEKFKEQFKNNKRSHVGEKNPMYGHTPDMCTPEQREKYSLAAIDRVLRGVSGYKTGHLTGERFSKKANKNLKFKSSWELIVMIWLDLREDVRSYDYESLILALPDGKRTIPDFIVNLQTGDTVVYEVKPTAIQHIPKIAEKLQNTRNCLKEQGIEYHLIGNLEIKKIQESLGKELADEINYYENR